MSPDADPERLHALDTLAVALESAARSYASGAEIGSAQTLSAAFRKMAETRQVQAHQVRDAIRALGDLPDEPDPDRVAIDAIWQRLKQVVSADELPTLIDHAIGHEDEIAAAIVQSRSFRYHDEITALLDACADFTDTTRYRLCELRDAAPDLSGS